MFLIFLSLLTIVSASDCFPSPQNWENLEACVLNGEVDLSDGHTLSHFIAQTGSAPQDEDTFISRVQFLINRRGYYINPHDGDYALSIACSDAPRKVIELLLKYPKADRNGREQNVHQCRQFYTDCLHNNLLDYNDILHVWNLLVANGLAEPSFYFYYHYDLHPESIFAKVSADEHISLLNFGYENEHIIKPTERKFWLYIGPEYETYNRWMAAHNVTPRNFSMREYKRPEDIPNIVQSIVDLGFDPYTIIDWYGWLRYLTDTGDIDMAEYVLSTYPQQFEKSFEWIDFFGLKNRLNKISSCDVEKYIRFIFKYILPLTRIDVIKGLLQDKARYGKRDNTHPELIRVMQEYVETVSSNTVEL